jgi:hypothetical protein
MMNALETTEETLRRIVREEVEAVFARQPSPVWVTRELPMIRLYTIPDVAELLDVSPGSVYNYIADYEAGAADGIRAIDIGRDGRSKKRIRADDYNAFVERRS